MEVKDIKDHREIGKEQDLFSFHEFAPGAVFWHPKGWFIYQQIMTLLRSILAKAGYEEIKTPVMIKSDLFKKSGHWQHFGENNMFNLAVYDPEELKNKQLTDVNYSLKPMNCPESTLVYNARPRSYKDLPLKYSDFGILHRRELSGVLGGLFRVREFTIDDAHIYVRNDQIMEIISELLSQIKDFYKLFGLNLRFHLSTKPDKALDVPENPKAWEEAEAGLKKALEKEGVEYGIKEKDGAFYGPKIDFHMTDSQERDWQLATIQLDFQMPRSLDVMYTNEKGEKEYAVMIHRAFTGSIERFIGILVEQFQGIFPLWLSPVQVSIMPVAERHLEAAEKAHKLFMNSDIRSEINKDNKTLGAKIREATLQKVPYMVIIGDKEQEKSVGNTVMISARARDGKDLGSLEITKFINTLKEQIEHYE